MKSTKSFMNEFRLENREVRTDRIARELIEDAKAEHNERSRILRAARLAREAQADTGVRVPEAEID